MNCFILSSLNKFRDKKIACVAIETGCQVSRLEILHATFGVFIITSIGSKVLSAFGGKFLGGEITLIV